MATVNKDFRIKAGLIVEGANATVNGEDIITTGSSTDNLTEGTTNKYFTDQRALDATSAAYDAAGAASAAQTAAQNYADGLAVNYDAAGAATTAENNAKSYADGLAINYDAAGSATTAENNAKSYADGLASNYDVAGAAAAALSSANGYTDTAISNLVNGAPALLDTLNELAAAINDDASFASTIATQIGGKQNTLTAGDGISIVSDTIAVDSTIATKSYVDTAVSTGVGAIDTDSVPEGSTNLYFTTQRAVDAIGGSTPSFTSIDITWVRKEEATWTNVPTAGTVTAHTFTASEGSVKYLVRVFNAGASQVSEVLVTTDSSNNVSVLEYGTIYTSEAELATVTADWDAANSQYRLRVTTVNNSSEILVAATMLARQD